MYMRICSHFAAWSLAQEDARRKRRLSKGKGETVIIECPQCKFSQDVNSDRISGESVIVTCPKCQCRFRFSRKNGAENILPPAGWKNMDAGRADKEGDEEEDPRQIARRAYEKEAERFSKEGRSEAGEAAAGQEDPKSSNPWADAKSGWFSAFYQTVMRVMFSAPAFFRSLDPAAGQGRPLAFYLLICVFQTFVQRIWGDFFRAFIAEYASRDPQIERLLAMLTPEANMAYVLLISCGALVLQLYVFSWLMAMVYRLLGAPKATFSLLFQIMAYSTAPALLCIVPALGSIAGLIWSLACLIMGCQAALNLGLGKTLAGFLPLLILFLPMLQQINAILGQ